MNILVTGAAGFIGFHLSKALLSRGDKVVGLDNINDYYDPQLKRDRQVQLTSFNHFQFHQLDLVDHAGLSELFDEYSFDCVVNLAAQAGVRHSLENPHAYIQSNLVGFANLIELCRQHCVANFVFASSSSVYGANQNYPFSETHTTDHPLALYGATKKANEVMAHSYAHLFKLPCTGLRFFTVYGPWGRPDMALFKFTENILADKPIEVYNHGEMLRDFTYVDDIVVGIIKTVDQPAIPAVDWQATDPACGQSNAPYRIYNIGHGSPVKLMDFIYALERALGRQARIQFMPMQPGDVSQTYADTTALACERGYQPDTTVETGIKAFVAWYKQYYNLPDMVLTQDQGA